MRKRPYKTEQYSLDFDTAYSDFEKSYAFLMFNIAYKRKNITFLLKWLFINIFYLKSCRDPLSISSNKIKKKVI